MSMSEWTANLLQGSVGAVIGLVGLFGVFWLTRRHEIARDRARHVEEVRETRDHRTRANVIRIVEAAQSLRLHHSSNAATRAEKLSYALTLFGVEEIADHPGAAKWAHRQSSEILRLADADVDLRALPYQAGYITGLLSAWVERGFPEDVPGFAMEEGGAAEKYRIDPDPMELGALLDEFDRSGKILSHESLAEALIARRSGVATSGNEAVNENAHLINEEGKEVAG